MDSLQPVLQPLLRTWRGLSRPQQIGLGAVVAAALGLLFVVSTFGHSSDTAVAFSGLSTDDEAAIVGKLKDAKIPYELADGGTIKVPSGQLQDAKLATAGLGIAGKPAPSSGFALFDQPSFGQTEFTQKVNYQRALENELEMSIDQMDAVDSSRVHLVMPEQTLFASQQPDTTASVMLKLKPGKHLDTAQARSISNLVAGAVQGLKPQNLTIVDVNGNTLTPDDSNNVAGLTNSQLNTEAAYESSTQQKLQAMLDGVLGPGKATVRVSALMNWDQVEQTNETYTPNDPTQTPVVSSHQITETDAAGSSAAGGVPGAASNNGAVPTYQGQTTGSGGSTKSDIQTNYQLNKSVQKVVTAPGAVKRLSVAVMLDDDPTNPNTALQQSVQTAVNAAAGIDPTRGDVLTVTPVAFNKDQMLAQQAEMATATQQQQYLQYAHLGALVLGPLLLLGFLFLILRRRGSQTPQVVVEPVPTGPNEPAALPADDDTAAPLPGRRPMKPVAQPIGEDPQRVYIREQIEHLGKSNPATVAQLIQTWMDEDRRN